MQVPTIDGSYATGASGSTGATASTASTGASASSGSAGSAPPGIDPALWASFAVFRQPGPNPIQPPDGLDAGDDTSDASRNPFGIDPNFDQYAPSADTWIQAGTSGLCTDVIGVVGPPPIGSGSCAPSSLALAGDYFDSWPSTWPHTHVFKLVGLAPDGNTAVTVTDTDGSNRQVPVTNNVYVVTGGHPSSVTLRDASGTLTTVPIPTTGG
jgi:hypothetical protein